VGIIFQIVEIDLILEVSWHPLLMCFTRILTATILHVHDILAFACISSSYQLLRFAPCPKRHPRIDRDLLKEGPELILACEMDGRAARTRTMELGDESYD
jgi:hypothetical protein